jgi:CheY-like chemotaxis protein
MVRRERDVNKQGRMSMTTRKELAAYRPTDLARLTKGLVSAFAGAIEKAGLAFKVEVQDLDEPVFVDHDMWEKIVLNLLSNAFKFTFAGEIELRLQKREGFAHLTVRDTGSSMPAEALPNLFQRFHRVAGAQGRVYEGSGIGLALVGELVKLYGGTVSVTSQPGAGSAFEVAIPLGSSHLPAHQVRQDMASLPLDPQHLAFVAEATGWLPNASPPRAAQAAGAFLPVALPANAPGALLPARRRRILIAEDTADMRAYLMGLLQCVGEVEAVEDGMQALESIRRSRPDLIVSDIMMPHLDGLQFLARLRADPAIAGIASVLLSARAGEKARIEGLQLGANAYLVKPFSANELVARVSTQLKLGEMRRLAETERKRLYEFFLQAQIPLAILLGAEHRFFLANAPYKKLVGKRVIGKTVLELFEKAQSDLLIPLLDQVYATGVPLLAKEVGFRLAGPDGVMQGGFINLSVHPFRESSGEITGLLAVVIDVTQQVRARTAIEDAVAQPHRGKGPSRTLRHDLDPRSAHAAQCAAHGRGTVAKEGA